MATLKQEWLSTAPGMSAPLQPENNAQHTEGPVVRASGQLSLFMFLGPANHACQSPPRQPVGSSWAGRAWQAVDVGKGHSGAVGAARGCHSLAAAPRHPAASTQHWGDTIAWNILGDAIAWNTCVVTHETKNH